VRHRNGGRGFEESLAKLAKFVCLVR
jgi:hypothetical protein